MRPRSLFGARPRGEGLQLRAVADGAELLIYDEIVDKFIADLWGVGICAADVAEFLKGVTAGTLHVRVNSPGGLVFEGVAIYNQLRQWSLRTGGRVLVHVDGVAASIASVIALAGDEVRIAPNAFFMIHNAMMCACGDAEYLRKVAGDLEKMQRGAITKTYMAKTGQDQATLEAWMRAETWFTADEAVEHGFADVIEEDEVPEDAAARARAFDLRAYEQVPAALREAAPADPPVRKAERALRDAGFTRQAAKVGALAAERVRVGQREAGDEELAVVVAEVQRLTTTIRSATHG